MFEILFFILGTVFGSFLNVVILRAFSGESIVLPPSKCPVCKEKLKCLDNIPILSYIFLRGKCRYCDVDISPQYPVIEALTGLFFVLTYLKFGINSETLFILIIGCFSIVMCMTDIKEQVVFDAHTISFAIIGLVYAYFYGTISNSLIAMGGGIVIMEMISLLTNIITKQRAFGVGDTFIVAGMGAVLGLKNLFIALFLSLIVQFIIIIPKFFYDLCVKKEIKMAVSLALSIFLICMLAIISYTDIFILDYGISFIVYILTVFSALYTCINLLKSIKTGKSLTFYPFGPALLISMLILIFLN